MSQRLPHRRFALIALASLTAILLATSTLAALAAAPAKVNFKTSGLPAGLGVTVTGTHTNPGGHSPIGYTTTFTSPGPSGDVSSEPWTTLTFNFPLTITSGIEIYTLLSTTPTGTLTVGDSGSSTTVFGNYGMCSEISVTKDPTNVTTELGAPATFSVEVTGSYLTFQWRRNGENIPGADGSSYTIASVDWPDNGDVFDVVVTNGCSSDTSSPGTLTVTKKSQTIDFPEPATPQFYLASFGLSATSSSGLTVNFSVSGGCSLVGASVTMNSGTTACVITARQAGDSDYFAAADVEHTVAAAKLDQVITFTQPASPQIYGDKFNISPTSDSSTAVSVNASGSCSYNSGEVTMTSGTGDCTLTASQAGDDNYNSATEVVRTVTAAKKDQTITFTQPASPQTFGDKFSVSPTSDSSLPVSVYASGSCVYAAGEVTITSGLGECTLTASQAGNGNYKPASDIFRTVAVAKKDQVITFTQPTSPAPYGSQFNVNPSADSGLAVILIASGGCTNTGFNITMTSSTIACTLTASQAGNGNYNPAPDIIRTVAAIKADQAITFIQPASPAAYGSQFTVNPTASSGLAVALVASGGCAYDGATITMTSSTVACSLTASQAGNASYNAAPDVVRTVTAAKANQAITFAQPPNPVANGSSFVINPTASSGLAVNVLASGACSLNEYTVTVSQLPGNCTLTASQPGNEFYNPAPDVTHTLEVTLKDGKIFIPILFSR